VRENARRLPLLRQLTAGDLAVELAEQAEGEARILVAQSAFNAGEQARLALER
jgi:hypothetical protein